MYLLATIPDVSVAAIRKGMSMEPASPHERLKEARQAAGYDSAADAARAFGWSAPLYRHHENGTRGISSKRALIYSRAFKVSPSWLMAISPEKSPSRTENLYNLYSAEQLTSAPGDFLEMLARDYGLLSLKKVKLSSFKGERTGGVPYDWRETLFIDADVLRTVISPASDSKVFDLLSVVVDTEIGPMRFSDGAVFIVDSSLLGEINGPWPWFYSYAGSPCAGRLWFRPDGMIEIFGLAGPDANVRAHEEDVALWGRIIWIGGRP